MGDTVIPQPLRAWNSNGRPSAGARATFFLSGTTTPATVYSDYAETTPHPSPLIADSAGAFPPIYRSGVALKCVLTDANLAALPGSPIDPVPIVRELGASASDVTFAASGTLPFTDVQAAIDGGIGGIVGGTIPFTGPILGQNGSAAAVAIGFAADADTGMFRPNSNEVGFATNGVARETIRDTEIVTTVPVRAPSGAAATPQLSFSLFPTTGLYAASNTLGFSVGGASVGTFGPTGMTVVGNISAGNVLSGSYTPTLTHVTNVAASTAYVTFYTRVGNIVEVFGAVLLDPTTASIDTELAISLPIATNLTNQLHLAGSCGDLSAGAYGEMGVITGDDANDRARLLCRPVGAGSRGWNFKFSYLVA